MGSNWVMAMMVIALFGPTPPAWAGEVAASGNAGLQGSGCHPLLLATECARYEAQLARLPAGSERSRLLAEQRELLRDREQACNCLPRAEMVILKPLARKATYAY